MPAFSDFRTPQDYGAPANGEIAAQCQAILNDGFNLYIPYGAYSFNWLVSVPGNRSVLGSPQRPRISTPVNNGVLFDVVGSDVRIENIWGDFYGMSIGAGLVRLRNDILPLERIELRRLIGYGGNSLVYDMPGPNYIVSLTCEEVVGRIHRGIGFQFNKVFAYLRMVDNLVDYVGSANHNFTAYSTVGNQGAWWERCDVTGGQVDATVTGNHGFYFRNSVANWISNCMADTVGGGGLFLDGGNDHFYVSKFVSSLVGTHPFSINGSNRVTLAGCEAGGRAGQPYAPAYPGFVLVNSPNLIVDDACRAYNNAGGVSYISNCPNSRINPFSS